MAGLRYDFGVTVTPFGRVARGAVGFRIDSKVLEGSLRRANGQFGGPLQAEFARVHEEMSRHVAESMQDVLVEQIQLGISRQEGGTFSGTDRPRSGSLTGGISAKRLKGRGKGLVPKTNEERLKNILVQDGNFRYDSRRFVVGIEEHLNASLARRYWKLLEDGGSNPAARFNFSDEKGPRYAPNGLRVASSTIPAYKYLADGAKRGLRYVRSHIAEEYRDAGAGVGQKITIRKGSF